MTAIFEVDCYSETTIFVWPLHLGNVLPEITVYTHSTRHRYITSQSSPIALKHLKHLDRGSMEIKRPRFTEFIINSYHCRNVVVLVDKKQSNYKVFTDTEAPVTSNTPTSDGKP